jgi:hypothetical protein
VLKGTPMAFLHRAIAAFSLAAAALIACAQPPIVNENDTDPPKTGNTAKITTAPAPKKDASTPACTDLCAAGMKRCSPKAGAGTEICAKAATGCTAWTQGTDCAAGSSCDATKNDGSCLAGCTDDVGCSAANIGAENCTIEGGRSRITCAKVGTCFRWQADTSCDPDEACSAGQCAAKCQDACTADAVQCTGLRGRETCVMQDNGCTAWQPSTGCSPDETCTSGVCQ